MSQIRLHGLTVSGHVHRVELFLRVLGLDYEFVEANGEVRATAGFRRLNPLGQIPVLEDGDVVLADSNAILVYLAKRYDNSRAWLPEDPVGAARVQRWFSVAAGEVAFGPAAARAAKLWGYPADTKVAQAVAQRVLGFMEQHLTDRAWLAADYATLADIACYGYVARAPEGEIRLEPYPSVRGWLARIEAMPAFTPMPISVPAAA